VNTTCARALDATHNPAHTLGMERSLRIRVAYAPTRLAADPLRHAYERIVPVARRVVRTLPEGTPVATTGVLATRKEKVR